MFCCRLFPGQNNLASAACDECALTTTLAGGVGNGYFASTAGGRGFDSRGGTRVLKALWSERRKRPLPLVPRPLALRQVRIEMNCHEQTACKKRHPGGQHAPVQELQLGTVHHRLQRIGHAGDLRSEEHTSE